MKNLLANFICPEKELRGAPFWAWNSTLDIKKLRHQIRIMKQMGFGGFYMHSRTGLNTPYLGDEWFECIGSCIDEAEKQGMYAWLYDEDRWPSGAAGGIVTSDDRFKARKIKYCKGDIDSRETLSRFAMKVKDSKILRMRRLQNGERPEKGEEIYSFFREYMEKSSWFNGETYLDTMNPEAVKEFLNVTHQRYWEKFHSKFASVVPGIFSDEPCYIHGDVSECLPWTDSIPRQFAERFGYDLLDHIPELFFDTAEEVSRARHDFYDLITELFVKAFSFQIGEWCEKHNLQMTGHVLGEDLLSTQILYVGASMRFYEYMQIPGVDILTEHWNVFNTVKQCTSVARQFGKKRRLTESYACTGWDFPFAGHKALCDWQYAMGINRRCLHLAWYSMEAEAKRDYPASISFHSPWHEKYPVVENYFARLGAVIQEGNEIRDLLVIHPIESLWSIMIKDIPSTDIEQENRKVKPGCKALDGYYSERVNVLDRAFTDLTNLLLRENIDFDFGDEEIISRCASATEDVFRIGQADYRMILIPELKTVRTSTLAMLKQFNGPVFYLGTPPRYVDAVPSDAAAEAYRNFISASRNDLAEKISGYERRVSVCEPDGRQAQSVLFRLADCGDSYSFFLCNTSMPFTSELKMAPLVYDRRISYPSLDAVIRIPDRGPLHELDMETGSVYRVPCSYKNGAYHFHTALNELQTRMFLFSAENIPEEKEPPPPAETTYLRDLPSTAIPYELDEQNVLVLDHAAYTIDHGPRRGPAYILHIDDELRAQLGEVPRGGMMVQPWMAGKNHSWKKADLELEYTFQCDIVPSKDCRLAIEHPEFYRIEFNGVVLKQESCGFWIEEVLTCLRLPCQRFRNGDNTLRLFSQYDCGQRGLECLYILGEFGVGNQDTIIRLPSALDFGDWCGQGLPNYAGNLKYRFEISEPQPSILKFGKWRGVLLGVQIDEEEERLLPWPPYQVSLPGTCALTITVYGHRRNALGPFYLKEKWPVRTGPHQYKMYESSQRQLVPCGLLEPPTLWNFLKNGKEENI